MEVPATFQVVADPADRNHVGDARHDPELAALNQVSEDPVRQAFDRLKNKSLFSYGTRHRAPDAKPMRAVAIMLAFPRHARDQ